MMSYLLVVLNISMTLIYGTRILYVALLPFSDSTFMSIGKPYGTISIRL